MMNTQTPNPDSTDVLYTLVLRPLKSDIPPIIRLRRVLKSLLRTYEFRCVDHRMTPTPSHAYDTGNTQVGSGHTNAVAVPMVRPIGNVEMPTDVLESVQGTSPA